MNPGAWRFALAQAAVVAAAAIVGSLLGSIAAGLAVGFGTLLVWHGINFARFSAWARRPLQRPAYDTGPWPRLAARVHNSVLLHRNRTRNALRQLRGVRAITEALPDAAVVLNRRGEIQDSNSAAHALLGLTGGDRGRALTDLVRHPLLASLMRGEHHHNVIEIASPIVDSRRLELRLIDIDDARCLVLARDVTELNRLLTMRQDFIANVSHELRTPLTVIVGYLEAMLGDPPDANELRDLVGRLQSPTRRMQALVEDLLLLTRLEASGNPAAADLEALHVPTLLQPLLADAEGLSNGRHELDVQVRSELRLVGIASELQSALGNLINNAVRYSPDGGRITIRWSASADGGVFEVCDEGVGIPPEHLSRLTERFYRVDLSGARVRGGTGLGLAIVKHVLKRHDCVLDIDSQLGRGSRFYFHVGTDHVAPAPAAAGVY